MARYLAGNRVDQWLARWRPSDGAAWYLTDRLGSVRDLVNAAGHLVNHIDYTSFGEPYFQSNPNDRGRVLFAGRIYEPVTGQLYLRARELSPQMRRFISQDPTSFSGNDANLYRYVLNSPVHQIDPLGTGPIIDYAWRIGRQAGGRALHVVTRGLRGLRLFMNSPGGHSKTLASVAGGCAFGAYIGFNEGLDPFGFAGFTLSAGVSVLGSTIFFSGVIPQGPSAPLMALGPRMASLFLTSALVGNAICYPLAGAYKTFIEDANQ